MAFSESECIWLSCIATCFIALMILFLHCKDVIWGLISFSSTPPPPLSQPLQLLQCIVDEVSLCPMYENVPNGVESWYFVS